MTIGEQIRKYRKQAGISQKILGERLGVSQQHIAQYENGKRIPKTETIRKIAYALNVPITEFIFSDGLPIHSNEEEQSGNNRYNNYAERKKTEDIRQFCKWVQSTGIAVTPRIIKDEIDGVVFVIKDKSYLIKNQELEKIISMSLNNVENVIETIGKEVSW